MLDADYWLLNAKYELWFVWVYGSPAYWSLVLQTLSYSIARITHSVPWHEITMHSPTLAVFWVCRWDKSSSTTNTLHAVNHLHAWSVCDFILIPAQRETVCEYDVDYKEIAKANEEVRIMGNQIAVVSPKGCPDIIQQSHTSQALLPMLHRISCKCPAHSK